MCHTLRKSLGVSIVTGIKVRDCPECGLLNPEMLLLQEECIHCGADMSLPPLSKNLDSQGKNQWEVIQALRASNGEKWYQENKQSLRSRLSWDEYLKLGG